MAANGPLPKPVTDAKEQQVASLKASVLPTLAGHKAAQSEVENLGHYATDSGIYGFHPVSCGVYSESEGLTLTPEEMACCVKCWWDGQSPCWTSELQFNNLMMAGHKLCLRDEVRS